MGLANIQTQVTTFNVGFIAAHKKVWINLEASTTYLVKPGIFISVPKSVFIIAS